MKSGKERIEYLDGCKALMGILIVLAHYTMAFFPKGYIGFGGNYAPEEAAAAFHSALPWSLFCNSSVILYLLFGILSFLVTVAYYRSSDRGKFLRRQAVKRYFRFVIPVAAATILTFVCYRLGVLHFQDMAKLTGAEWNKNIMGDLDDPSVLKMLYSAFVGIFIKNDVEYLTVLWCMHIIFIGSFLTYAFLSLFGQSGYRYFIYVVWLLLALKYPDYLVFLAGIVCGDRYSAVIYGNDEKTGSFLWNGWKREGTSLILSLVGIAIGVIPYIYLPKPLTVQFTYGVAVFLILAGMVQSDGIQKMLSFRFHRFGKYLFSLILVHIWVLYSVSYAMFRWLYHVTGAYVLSFWVDFIVSLAVSCAASVVYYKIFEQPSKRLAERIALWEDKEWES